ncbi:MAG: DUF1326 domain-containing protein [Acidimicrobiia bacterium]
MTWEVRGSYYEACNCEAVCPCRRQGDRQGGRSTYETCDFVLSWMIEEGDVEGRDLSGLSTVMVGSYSDDEPGSPWRVVVFVDQTADEQRQQDLSDVFLGRLGGDTHRLYGRWIEEGSMVRPAEIRLIHTPGRWRIGVSTFVEVRSTLEATTEDAVSCGISDHLPGTELISDVQVVAAPPFEWELRERCAFQSLFSYRG